MSARGRVRGFTLLELMIVMAIIALMVGMASYQVGQGRQARALDQIAQTLIEQMNRAVDFALFHGSEIAIEVSAERLTFLQRPARARPDAPQPDQDARKPKPEWILSDNKALVPVNLSDELALELEVDQVRAALPLNATDPERDQKPYEVQLQLDQTGEWLQPFRLAINHEDSPQLWLEIGERGRLQISDDGR